MGGVGTLLSEGGTNLIQKKQKKLQPSLRARHAFLPAYRKRLRQRDPERLEDRLALVVVVSPGERDVGGDPGLCAESVEEVLEDIALDAADRCTVKLTIVHKVSPAPAVQRHLRN
jgi:hypothetical protein